MPLKFITNFINLHPFTSLNLTTASIFCLSDSISQSLTSVVSLNRLLTYTLVGAIFVGPSSYIWHKKALPQIVLRFLGHEAKKIKYVYWATLIDQVIYAPLATFGTIQLTQLISQKIGSQKQNKMDIQDIKQAIKMGWRVWPVALILAYRIPIRFRPILINCIGILWNIYLSDFIFNGK